MSSESNSTSGTEDVSVVLGTDENEEIEDRLEYGDSKSGWIREACQMRLEQENESDETLTE